jgi:hypothetical protein
MCFFFLLMVVEFFPNFSCLSNIQERRSLTLFLAQLLIADTLQFLRFVNAITAFQPHTNVSPNYSHPNFLIEKNQKIRPPS